MGERVKTTVDIDDDLLVAAKKHAAEHRRSLRSLIEAGLRDQLAPRRARSGRVVTWVVVDGALPTGLPDLADRAAMHEWIGTERSKAP